MDKLRPLIAIAFSEHRHSWKDADADFFERAQTAKKERRPLEPETLRNLATVYKVSRGLRKGKEAEYSRLIFERTRSGWPTGLPERLELLKRIVNEASEGTDPLTNGSQASLASKAIWFFYPERWFLYDRFVSAALRIQGAGTLDRACCFEGQIAELCDSKFLQDLKSNLEKHAPQLHAERVIDKFLMFIGMSLFSCSDPATGVAKGAWRRPDESDYAFADDVYALFESSELVARLRALSLP
ncbi:hypothetical protein [uncultured Salipiger sp.]|jgi:hypothetical protein|uniref:hypothetical protein n=1 Tax=uncultured Salipiger sp. TaxID=499810 RepID=UPI0025923646|nr:hypothetical protein [uncultured Salipiger sp.]MBR9838185.1 hypothetical protein [Paracoccaceae bacterium]